MRPRLRKLVAAVIRRVPYRVRIRRLELRWRSLIRGNSGLKGAVYRGRVVLARRWEGPFSTEALAELQLRRCVELLNTVGVEYFMVRGRGAHELTIGVDSAHRERVLERLCVEYARTGVHVGSATRPELSHPHPLASRRFVRRLNDTGAIRVGEYVVGEGRHAVAGPDQGCVIEFWREGTEILAEPDGGQNTLSSLKVVASEERLRESIVAPRPNLVSDVVPGPERKPAQCHVRGRSHPTITAFTRTLVDDITFPIDAVYTWVDGTDPRWSAARDAHLDAAGRLNPTAASESRYTSHDELLYSLRSLEMFAGFLRNIYIVTDGQVPEWLNTKSERVRIVDHRDIFDDHSALPVFNSHAIETRLHHIDGLAEHYLYLNDDVFFGRPVPPDRFFHPNGTAKVIPSTYQFGLGEADVDDQPVDAAAKTNRELVESDFGRFPTYKFKHTPIPQRRSVLFELERRYPEKIRETMFSRFRRPSDVSLPSSLHHYYAMLTGRATLAGLRYSYLSLNDRHGLAQKTKRLLERRNFDTFCVNDTLPADDPDASERILRGFLPAYFPFPSSFES